jgi:hypothetical protein
MSVNKPLNNIDIQNKVGCDFILYENMMNIRNINELLPKTLILYQLHKVGHFCCVFKNDEGINFFDPLGIYVDDELLLTSPDRKHKLHHDFTYLTKLLSDVKDTPIIYNEYQLQGHKTSTCGDWCAIRMIYSDLFNDEFKDCFNGIKNRDKLIVKLYNSF